MINRMIDIFFKWGFDDFNVWGEYYVLFGYKRFVVVDIEGGC